MRPVVARRRAPSCSFEGCSVDEAVVYGKKSLADAVGNVVEIARTQLVGDETGDSLADVDEPGCAAQHSLFDLKDGHDGAQVVILQTGILYG